MKKSKLVAASQPLHSDKAPITGQPLSKRAQLIGFVQVGDYKSALRLANSFRAVLTREQQRTVQIAYEILSGREQFYKQIKTDTEQAVAAGKKVLHEVYLSDKAAQ